MDEARGEADMTDREKALIDAMKTLIEAGTALTVAIDAGTANVKELNDVLKDELALAEAELDREPE